jgi:hypothetical protein
MIDLAKLGALALVAGVFIYGLKKDWDGVYIVFGFVFLLGSCQMIGVK